MSKKILYYFGGTVITLFLLLTTQVNFVLASEGECHLKHCLVPAPTILMPSNGDVVYTSRPEIRGLSWKTTIVKVYIDGNELENVQFKKHKDYYGSFFVVPNYDLLPGEHYIYTIAHSEKPGWFDQSKESTYIDITVKKIIVSFPPVAEQIKKTTLSETPESTTIEPESSSASEESTMPDLSGKQLEDLSPESKPKDLPILQEEVSGGSEQNKTVSVDIVDLENPKENFKVIDVPSAGEVDVSEGQIEGGVLIDKESDSLEPTLQEAAGLSDLGELLKDEFKVKNNEDRERRNRLIGLVMLAVILVVTIIWLIVERQNKLRREIYDDDEGELPPAPAPPLDRQNKSISLSASDQPSQDRSQGKPQSLKDEKKAVKSEPADQKPNRDDDITIEPINEEADLMAGISKSPNGEYWASPPPSPYSPYPTPDESDEKQDDLGV